MFGMSAERSEAQRPPRIDTGGTPARIDTGGTPARIDSGGTPPARQKSNKERGRSLVQFLHEPIFLMQGRKAIKKEERYENNKRSAR